MVFHITTIKRKLTKNTRELESLLAKYEGETLRIRRSSETEDESKELLKSLRDDLPFIRTLSTNIEKLLQDYDSQFSSLPDPTEKEEEEHEKYASKAVDVLTEAERYDPRIANAITELEKTLNSCKNPDENRDKVESSIQRDETTVKSTIRRLELPTIPIPMFTGDIWEWDNFWELYNANVHSQDIPDYSKFNYLTSAIQGEASNIIKKYQVSNEGYDLAIQALKNKYGNPQKLIEALVDKLDECCLKAPTLAEERRLFEEIQTIVAQLVKKGQDVDNQWMIKNTMSKFPRYIRNKVLDKQEVGPNGGPLNMQTLLQYLEEIITKEERKASYKFEKEPKITRTQRNTAQVRSCMYCRGEHKAFYCDTYATAKERLDYLLKNKLCTICASSQHSTSQCYKASCHSCQGRHHTSCCIKSNTKDRKEEQPKKDKNERKEAKQDVRRPKVNVSNNQLSLEPDTHDKQINATTETTVQTEDNEESPIAASLPLGNLKIVEPVKGDLKTVPVVLDSGSGLSFIDTKLADELNLPTIKEMKLMIRTFGSKKKLITSSRRVKLEAWDIDGKQLTLDLFTNDDMTSLCKLPQLTTQDKEFMKQHNYLVEYPYDGRKLVKPSILIGSNLLWKLIKKDQRSTELPSGLDILSTRLGYCITGKVENTDIETEGKEINDQVYMSLFIDPDTEEENGATQSMAIVELEESPETEKEEKKKIDMQVWQNFKRTVEKRLDGYYVHLPWKHSSDLLPDNWSISLKRLHQLWNDLKKEENLLDQYNEIFTNQIRENILEDIGHDPAEQCRKVHYIPHQAIWTPHKTTTKIRIVFDASAHYKGCLSLNDILHPGPVILPELYGILLRFRFGKIGFTADIEKAFLQVRLHEDDRDFTRCLWLHDHRLPPEPDNIRILRFTRVTFGLNASPFLLAATIHHHMEQYKAETNLVNQIKENMYVDNLVMAVDDTRKAREICKRTKQIFNELSMNLREFTSNNDDILTNMHESDKSEQRLTKVLGITWNATTDELIITCDPKVNPRTTKRTVASSIQSIFDPLGWLIPLTHKGRRFLQKLWEEQYDWDQELPKKLVDEWIDIQREMQKFEKVLSRAISTEGNSRRLITCADASKEAIAASIYLQGDTTNLLMAKSKLTSSKYHLTIPKLELEATALALRLTESLLSQIGQTISIEDIYILSDSKAVLSWIKNQPMNKVGRRIFNRLAEIRKINSQLQDKGYRLHYKYIPSELNPADVATRGLDQKELLRHFWWTGPPTNDFIETEQNNQSKIIDQDEKRRLKMTTIPSEEKTEAIDVQTLGVWKTQSRKSHIGEADEIYKTLEKFQLTSVKRIVLQTLRFIVILVRRANKRGKCAIQLSPLLRKIHIEKNDNIKGENNKIAEKILVKQHQIARLTPTIIISLKALNIKQDPDGLFRCYGRLGNSELEDNTKNPLIVLQKSWLADKIIRDCHNKGHPGIGHTMSLVREKYWIPQLRSQIMQILRRCIQCQRFNNLPYKYPEQSDLPQTRVSRSRPFEHVGLDYFGPLLITQQDKTEDKCYGCIITCTVTRLIHLDVVSDLSTVAFLMMLRRFFSRRGVPKSITSDNAPTFRLGESMLNDCIQNIQNDDTVKRLVSDHEINWNYITPFAPWQGGFYERLIKSVKHSLYKSLGKTKPSYEQLSTVIIEVESLLNTRPLLYVESSTYEEQVLRPIDFIQNRFELPPPLNEVSEETDDPSYISPEERRILKTKQEVIKALQSSCRLTEKFWQTWKSHYLTSLREKHQSTNQTRKSSKNIPKKDQLVLINEPLQPRYTWKIGKIIDIKTNSEGIAREATLKLPSNRQIRRPINLLIPLEIEDESTMQEWSTREKMEHYAINGRNDDSEEELSQEL